MDSTYATQLQDIILSWDYWRLDRAIAAGKGPIEELPTIPLTFASVQVRRGRVLGGPNGTRP